MTATPRSRRPTALAPLLIAALAAVAGCTAPQATAPASPSAGPAPAAGGRVTLASGLVIEDLRLGSGAVVLPESVVRVRYTGTLENGSVFDATTGEETRAFELPRLIDGWRQGLLGMRSGGVRRLVVPPSLAYGRAGYGPLGIPPGAELAFEIELVAVEPTAAR